MFVKKMLLAVLAFFQVYAAFGQQQGSQNERLPSQQELIQSMSPTQLWNPYSWLMPYYAAASDAWGNYIRKAQEASNQLYQQWDRTGAANVFNTGLGIAQQYAQQATQFAAQQAQTAQHTAQQALQQAAKEAQDGLQVARDSAAQVFL